MGIKQMALGAAATVVILVTAIGVAFYVGRHSQHGMVRCHKVTGELAVESVTIRRGKTVVALPPGDVAVDLEAAIDGNGKDANPRVVPMSKLRGVVLDGTLTLGQTLVVLDRATGRGCRIIPLDYTPAAWKALPPAPKERPAPVAPLSSETAK
jgi:hypothetical protein